MMGIFSDMETGTKILLVIVAIALIYFGGGNIFKNGGGNGKGSSGGSSGGGTGGAV